MKIIPIILSLCGVLFASCFQPERDCAYFKKGSFRFEALVGTEVETTTFMRNDSIEIDYFRGKSDTSSIRWINDCEYIVEKLNPKNMAEEKAIHIKILSTKGNEYSFEYNIVGSQQKQRGKALKIE